MSKKQFDVLSPDGFSIHFSDTYHTIEQAQEALQEWAKRYEFQGYYSSVNYGRIHIIDLPDYCNIIEVETVDNE
jgi:hypothetical protein